MTTTTDGQLNQVNLGAVSALVEEIKQRPSAALTTWSAQVRWTGAFRSEAAVRGFVPITSDEPSVLGGTDSAPNPVEQLLGALGNCLAVGYAANASVAGITIRDLRIDLDGDIDLHAFLGLADEHAPTLGHARQSAGVHAQDELRDLAPVEIEPEAEERLCAARARDLRGHGQVDREGDHARRVVLVGLPPHHHPLRALRDDAQGGPLQPMDELRVRS